MNHSRTAVSVTRIFGGVRGRRLATASYSIDNINEILMVIANSAEQKAMWKRYQSEYSYAGQITYEDIQKILKILSNDIMR